MAQIRSVQAVMREDEWNIDFDDTRDFLIQTFQNANELHALSRAEIEQSNKFTSYEATSQYVYKEQTLARNARQALKASAMLVIVQFVKLLWMFEQLVQNLVVEGQSQGESEDEMVELRSIDTSTLWRRAYLNVKLSIESPGKLKNTSRWMNELRRSLDLLVNTIRFAMDAKTNDDNSIRIELMETFEPLIGLLHTSIMYLQRYFDEKEFQANWQSGMEPRINESMESLQLTIKHLREISTNSRINQNPDFRFAAEVGGLRQRTEAMDAGEKAIFPVEKLPPLRADHFTGRDKDLEMIHEWLGLSETPAIRTYTIYGRRGIGKTAIALEYARKHRRHYDAIFWIQSETKASLRQSFTDIALALELEGADNNTTFDENLMRVLRWLRHTQKKWLLIYDNAERENLLKGYWPTGGNGAMLLTSRSFYNFFEDDNRHGETVQLFNDDERRTFLMALLGERWQTTHLNPEDMMLDIEEAAISALLKKTGGLPIAIRHAAKMIVDSDINKRGTVRAFMEKFQDSFRSLPRRQTTERDPLIHSLDTIWKISFDFLENDARAILSGLSLLAPDSILIDLFLPSDQQMLHKKFDFCRTVSADSNVVRGGAIQTIVNPSSKLAEALDELSRKSLIKRVGRQISLHRTVQEAVNYQGAEELSEYYDAMVCLLFDSFPQQHEGQPLVDSYDSCRVWIQHVVTLANKFKIYTINRQENDRPLKAMASLDYFLQLLANAAWYLFEIADYEEALNIVAIARSAATDTRTLTFAHLLNTEGVTYYELNKLSPARRAMKACLSVRQQLLPENSVELANIYSNLCNVETAENNLESAADYFEKAKDIRESLGDESAMMLALSYQQMGRIHFLNSEYTQAYASYQKCEGILNKRVGRNRAFTASLHYAYGNLELAQDEFVSAAKSFETARLVVKEFNPMHPLTAATNYKLACTEFEQDHHKKALNYLMKALDIAEVRSGGQVDGTVARILWKKAEVMLDDPLGEKVGASQLMADVEFQQKEIADRLGVDLRGLDTLADREKSFDLLVPGYFR